MIKETYKEMKERQLKELEEFKKDCFFFAYSQEEFDSGMKKIGLKPSDMNKIYSTGHHSFILRSKVKQYYKLITKFIYEDEIARIQDTEGTGFIKQMFEYELKLNRDCLKVIDILGYQFDEIQADERLMIGLQLARKAI